MMKIFKKTLVITMVLLVAASFVSVLMGVNPVYATDAKSDVCKGVGLTSTEGSGCSTGTGPDASSIVGTVVNILSIVVGVIAVIYIIIGGVKYVTSSGDANNITAAKNTIMYAIVGLVIVALAQVIVKFVLHKVT